MSDRRKAALGAACFFALAAFIDAALWSRERTTATGIAAIAFAVAALAWVSVYFRWRSA